VNSARRIYVELAGDPFYGQGRASATVEVSADGECELVSGDVELLDLDDVFEAARAEARAA
jgi:hypothetical protein